MLPPRLWDFVGTLPASAVMVKHSFLLLGRGGGGGWQTTKRICGIRMRDLWYAAGEGD